VQQSSFSQALQKLYPEVQFDASKFKFRPQGYWSSIENMRELCDAYAKTKGFNPLQHGNWYSISRKDFLPKKDARAILKRFGSLATALINIYPDLPLQKSEFSLKP